MANTPIKKIGIKEYLLDPERYELRSGNEEGAPLCPYGNHFKWIGYDKQNQEYIRFTKSVFKILVNDMDE